MYSYNSSPLKEVLQGHAQKLQFAMYWYERGKWSQLVKQQVCGSIPHHESDEEGVTTTSALTYLAADPFSAKGKL
jgi:hypothetical protein